METTKDRLKEYLKYKGLSQRKFEISVGVSNGYVNNLKSSPSSDVIQKIFCVYPELNTTWLLSGEGEMLNEGISEEKELKEQNNKYDRVIRYWTDMDATGGGLESFDDIKSGYTPIVIPDFHDCTDAVNIVGESMEPTYKSGSVIVLKEWKERFIDFGNVYLIVTKNGNRMVKQITPGSDAGHITCKSFNPDYAPFEIEKEDVLRLYLVKGVISKSAM